MSAADSAVIDVLYDVLQHLGDSTIRRCDTPPGERAYVEFCTRMISINRAATRAEFVVSLLHELVHLKRGRAYVGDEEREERIVNETTARLAVPATLLTGVHTDLQSWAAELGVDVPTLRLALLLDAQDSATEGIS